MNAENSNPLSIPADLYKHEQTRWHAWTLFYLGMIAGVLYCRIALLPDMAAAEDKALEGLTWMLWLAAAVLSYLWCLTIVALRASTHAWREVIIAIEKGDEHNAFTGVEDRVWAYGWRDDLAWFLHFWSGPPSVTRLMGFLATLMTPTFAGMAISEFVGNTSLRTWATGFGAVLSLVALPAFLAFGRYCAGKLGKLGSFFLSDILLIARWSALRLQIQVRWYKLKIAVRVRLRASRRGHGNQGE